MKKLLRMGQLFWPHPRGCAAAPSPRCR